MEPIEEPTNWAPNRKIIAAAIAALAAWALQLAFPGIDVPPGVEGALSVVVGYWVPLPKT